MSAPQRGSVRGLRGSLRAVRPTRAEEVGACVGDEVVPRPDVVMDRGFSLPAPPEVVWPWIEQLGKDRAGWYLPATVERAVPASRRALRRVDPRWLGLGVGDVIPDWGGRDATFEVVTVDPPRALIYRSRRGRVSLSWALVLLPGLEGSSTTRVRLRLRLAGLRRPALARRAGGAVDLLTVAGLAAGLRERVSRRGG
jgi:hypothetical protein